MDQSKRYNKLVAFAKDKEMAAYDQSLELTEKLESIDEKITSVTDLLGVSPLSSLTAVKGDKGDKGDSIIGPVGPMGPRGERGEDGKSIVGPKGDKGDKGNPGRDGIDGIVQTPQELADKLNTLEGVIEPSVIKDMPTMESLIKAINSKAGAIDRRSINGLPASFSGGNHGAGVQQIVAGANITITQDPSTVGPAGTGIITINSVGGGGGGAPTNATYITQTPDATLTNEQALSLLATGIMKSTTGTGVVTTVSAPSGALVGTTDTQTLSNKTLDNTSIITIPDSALTIQSAGDATKQFQFLASGITAGATRILTVPDANLTVVGTTTTQTISNKTLDNTNTVTVKDSLFTLQDDADVTKQVQFQLGNIGAGTTRTKTFQNVSGVIYETGGTDVAVADGGTGQSTYTDGQLLIGNSVGSTLTKSTLTAGANISITNGNGSITISTIGAGGDVSSNTATSVVNEVALFADGTGKLIKRATGSGFAQLTSGVLSTLTATQATALLDVFVGDSGAGGTKGLVVPPAAGDAGKFLRGDGTWASVAGSGTVTNVSVVTANGVSGSVANPTTTPAITLTLGAITPSTVNGLTLTALGTGFTIAGGTTSKTLSVPLDASVSGNNTGDQTITLTGDVTGSGTGSFVTSIASGAVSNAKLASMSEATIKGRSLGSGSGSPINMTGTQVTAILDNFVGDAGAGGTKGLVPAPAAGDAAAGKFLKADGTWTAPAGGGGGTVTSVSVTTQNGVSATVTNPTTTPALAFTLGAITPTSVAASGSVTGSNLSGTNTGDQTITLTGDVTGSGTSSFATTIANSAVTLAKMANVATATFLGRTTAGTGVPEAMTVAQSKTLLNLAGTNTGDQTISLTGDVTGSGTSSFPATIALGAVTYSKMQNVSTTDRLLGRQTAGAGLVEEITCTAAGRALIDDASASAQRTTLGVVIGTDVQAFNSMLTTSGLNVSIGDGVNTITTGSKLSFRVPYTCTIQNVTLFADAVGSIVIDIKKALYVNWPTTASICAAALPTLSAARKSKDTTLTGWTTTLTQDDVCEIVVNSIATCKQVTLCLQVLK